MERTACCSVVELRQYTLVPGRRDDLIHLFENDLLEPQRDVGMHIVGTFVDVDDPDRFVWIRGFESDEARTQALRDFYLGPVWAAHRDRANSTMLDSDDVLLLRTASSVRLGHPAQPRVADVAYAITVYAVDADGDEDAAVASVNADVEPVVTKYDGAVVGVLRTNPAPNGFPRLPIREGERVIVVVSAHRGDPPSQAPSLAGAQILQHVRLAPTELSELC